MEDMSRVERVSGETPRRVAEFQRKVLGLTRGGRAGAAQEGPRWRDTTARMEAPGGAEFIVRYRQKRVARCGVWFLVKGTIFADWFMWAQVRRPDPRPSIRGAGLRA